MKFKAWLRRILEIENPATQVQISEKPIKKPVVQSLQTQSTSDYSGVDDGFQDGLNFVDAITAHQK